MARHAGHPRVGQVRPWDCSHAEATAAGCSFRWVHLEVQFRDLDGGQLRVETVEGLHERPLVHRLADHRDDVVGALEVLVVGEGDEIVALHVAVAREELDHVDLTVLEGGDGQWPGFVQ